jgi:hypothetical protein
MLQPLPTPTGTMNSFPKQLQQLDPHLDCKFNDAINKFVIRWQRQDRSWITLMIVEDEDGSFRHPDMRELVTLKHWDMEERRIVDVMREIAEYMVDARKKDRENASDLIRQQTIENKIQLIQVFTRLANVSKGNSAFRRIQAKARGQVY